MEFYDIVGKAVGATCDNGANFQLAAEYLQATDQINLIVRCMCHSLQLSIKGALEIKKNVCNIYQLMMLYMYLGVVRNLLLHCSRWLPKSVKSLVLSRTLKDA